LYVSNYKLNKEEIRTMGNGKLFNYELSEEMKRYFKDLNGQMDTKEGVIYEKMTNGKIDSVDEGYKVAIEEGYTLDREEFEKIANDLSTYKEMQEGKDGEESEEGELDLEVLEMVAGGMNVVDAVVYGVIGAVAVCVFV
jgi:hypothetical protein